MRDHGVSIGETGTEILGFKIGIVREDFLRPFALSEQAQNKLDGNPHPANDGFAIKNLGVSCYASEYGFIEHLILHFVTFAIELCDSIIIPRLISVTTTPLLPSLTRRDEKAILDLDLAALYGVSTTRLNEQVKRNKDRVPPDFSFRLTKDEWESLMSQFAISNPGRGGRRKLPYAFTEHGAIMAANVLNSKRAVQASVQVVRAFVTLREMLASNVELLANSVSPSQIRNSQSAI